MPEYDENSVVIGKYPLAFVQSAEQVSPVFGQKTQETLEERVGALEPDEWYSTEGIAKAYEELKNDVGPATMEEGGRATAKALPFDVDSLEPAFTKLNGEHTQAFRDSHMDYPAGQYTYELHGDRSGRFGVTKAYPFPEPFVEGLFDGFINRYGPSDAFAQLESVTPRSDEQFAWDVTW